MRARMAMPYGPIMAERASGINQKNPHGSPCGFFLEVAADYLFSSASSAYLPSCHLYQTYFAFLMSPFSFSEMSPRTVFSVLPARSHAASFLLSSALPAAATAC